MSSKPKPDYFIIANQPAALSPTAMNFCGHWIYDLSKMHSQYIEHIRASKNLEGQGSSVWAAMMQAYQIHNFCSALEIQRFARDYFNYFDPKISKASIEKVFQTFRRLGLTKWGYFLRLKSIDIQKRFGKHWKHFFDGLFYPQTTPWIWRPHKEIQEIKVSIENEDTIYPDAKIILNQIQEELEKLPSLSLSEFKLQMALYESSEDLLIDLQFSSALTWPRESTWLMRLLEERLHLLRVSEPISKINLSLKPAPTEAGFQLSLFQKRERTERDLEKLSQRLKMQNLFLFTPQIEPNHLPESCWSKNLNFHFENSKQKIIQAHHTEIHHQLRPLYIEKAKPIDPPAEAIWFAERLQWLNEDGTTLTRDYFIFFRDKKWIWAFRNLSNEWFSQGVVE